jgi:hypothetical protein
MHHGPFEIMPFCQGTRRAIGLGHRETLLGTAALVAGRRFRPGRTAGEALSVLMITITSIADVLYV